MFRPLGLGMLILVACAHDHRDPSFRMGAWNHPNSNSSISMKNNSGTFFAGFPGGAYLSLDGGQEWTQHKIGSEPAYVSAVVRSGNVLFASTAHVQTAYQRGMFRSDDNGSNWYSINHGLTSLYIIDMVELNGHFFAAAFDGVYRSVDGFSWHSVYPTSAPLFLLKDVDTVWVATFGAGILRSTDDGNSWQSMNNGLSLEAMLTVTLAKEGPILFAGTHGGLYRSDNFGNHWTRMDSTLTSPHHTQSMAVLDGELYVSNDQAIFRYAAETYVRSTESSRHGLIAASAGKLFLTETSGGIDAKETGSSDWSTVVPNFSNANIQLVAASTERVAVYGNAGFFVSHSGGPGWVMAVKPDQSSLVRLAVTSTRILAVTALGVYSSDTDGQTWSPATGLGSAAVKDILVLEETLVAGGTSGMVATSTDGIAWTVLDTISQVVCLAEGDGKYFAGTWEGLYYSSDKGASWKREDVQSHFIRSVGVLGNKVYIIDGDDDLKRSDDLGLTWFNTGFSFASAKIISVKNNLIISSSTGLYRLKNNEDLDTDVNEGLTNCVPACTLSINDLSIIGNIVYAGTAGAGIFRGSFVYE